MTANGDIDVIQCLRRPTHRKKSRRTIDNHGNRSMLYNHSIPSIQSPVWVSPWMSAIKWCKLVFCRDSKRYFLLVDITTLQHRHIYPYHAGVFKYLSSRLSLKNKSTISKPLAPLKFLNKTEYDDIVIFKTAVYPLKYPIHQMTLIHPIEHLSSKEWCLG